MHTPQIQFLHIENCQNPKSKVIYKDNKNSRKQDLSLNNCIQRSNKLTISFLIFFKSVSVKGSSLSKS